MWVNDPTPWSLSIFLTSSDFLYYSASGTHSLCHTLDWVNINNFLTSKISNLIYIPLSDCNMLFAPDVLHQWNKIESKSRLIFECLIFGKDGTASREKVLVFLLNGTESIEWFYGTSKMILNSHHTQKSIPNELYIWIWKVKKKCF